MEQCDDVSESVSLTRVSLVLVRGKNDAIITPRMKNDVLCQIMRCVKNTRDFKQHCLRKLNLESLPTIANSFR